MTAERDEEAYREYERPVMSMLATRYADDLDSDGRRELYHEAWAAVLRRRRSNREVDNLRSYLLGAADNLAAKRVYGADARRRQTFDPVVSPLCGVPDPAAPPEEEVLAADDARRVHLLIAELDASEAAILRLRIEEGLEPAEIRERLGLTDRQYRRQADNASKALLAEFRAFDRGDWARRKRSLLSACLMGIASERQQERAQELVQSDPLCRAMMNELRRLAGQAAALIPVPAVGTVPIEHVGGFERAAELATSIRVRAADLGADVGDRLSPAHLKERAADFAVGAKQSATNAYVRAADPTPLAGARPGAMGALVASCLAAGGGTYCAVSGVPEGLNLSTAQRQQEPTKRSEAPKPKRKAAIEAEPMSPAPPVATTQEPATAPPVAAAPAQPTVTAPPAPPPTPDEEFAPAGSGQGNSDIPPVSSTPKATPAPASDSEGEFAP